MDFEALSLGFLTLGAGPDPFRVLDAAAAGGFGAVGLRISGRRPRDDWPANPDAKSLQRIAGHAAALGIRICNIAGYCMAPGVGESHLLRNVEAAVACGTGLILQGCFEPDLQRAAALLTAYDRAAGEAGVRIAIEFMPMSSIRTIASALQLIEDCDARNVGLAFDALHLARSGGDAASVARVPRQKVLIAQFCDAAASLPESISLEEEAMHGRLHPGDGGLDLAQLARVLPAECEWELEAPVMTDAQLPVEQRAQRAGQKARRFLASLDGRAQSAGAALAGAKPE